MSATDSTDCDCDEGATDCTCFESDTACDCDSDTDTPCMDCYESDAEETTSPHKPLFEYIQGYRGTNTDRTNELCEQIREYPTPWRGHQYMFHSCNLQTHGFESYVLIGMFPLLCVACWEGGLFGEPEEGLDYTLTDEGQRVYYTESND